MFRCGGGGGGGGEDDDPDSKKFRKRKFVFLSGRKFVQRSGPPARARQPDRQRQLCGGRVDGQTYAWTCGMPAFLRLHHSARARLCVPSVARPSRPSSSPPSLHAQFCIFPLLCRCSLARPPGRLALAPGFRLQSRAARAPFGFFRLCIASEKFTSGGH